MVAAKKDSLIKIRCVYVADSSSKAVVVLLCLEEEKLKKGKKRYLVKFFMCDFFCEGLESEQIYSLLHSVKLSKARQCLQDILKLRLRLQKVSEQAEAESLFANVVSDSYLGRTFDPKDQQVAVERCKKQILALSSSYDFSWAYPLRAAFLLPLDNYKPSFFFSFLAALDERYIVSFGLALLAFTGVLVQRSFLEENVYPCPGVYIFKPHRIAYFWDYVPGTEGDSFLVAMKRWSMGGVEAETISSYFGALDSLGCNFFHKNYKILGFLRDSRYAQQGFMLTNVQELCLGEFFWRMAGVRPKKNTTTLIEGYDREESILLRHFFNVSVFYDFFLSQRLGRAPRLF